MALAGIAGGLAMRGRNNRTRNPLKKMSAPSMPKGNPLKKMSAPSMPKGLTKSVKKLDPSKVDLDSLASAAQRVGRISQQVGDFADAAEKARKRQGSNL